MSINLKASADGCYCLCDVYGQGRLDRANQFLRNLHTRSLSPNTIRAYGYDLLAFYRWLTGVNKESSSLTPQDLLDFIDAQRRANLSPRSINRRLVTVQAFCRFYDNNPINLHGSPYFSSHYRGRGRDRFLGLHKVRQPKHRLLQVRLAKKLVEPLSIQQVRLFLETISRYRDLAIVYLMLFCGLRSKEVLLLRMQDVSFENKQALIQGKGSKERLLPLPDTVLNVMTKYLTLERPAMPDSSSFFLVLQGKRKGQAMSTSGLRTLFRHRRSKPLLANANAHRWRHTFGTDMARAGSTLPVLQRLMGHSDARVTLQYINLSMVDITHEFEKAAAQMQQRYKKNDGQA